MNTAQRHAHIQLALTPHIGAESFAQLIAHYGNAENALSHSARDIAPFVHKSAQVAKEWNGTHSQTAAEAALQWEQKPHCRLILSCDPDYPPLLREGLTPPPLLFARGDITLLQRPSIGMVGSRHATPQAIRTAHDFAQALSQLGITVISGMAAGIDTAAHEGALPHSGRTIAVWGTGIDRIYPQRNQKLAHQIAENGLILSEFPLSTRPLAQNFPRRNRIIAAQSQGILVVEAALQSGSLITARQAGEMGREVMAIPSSIHNPHGKGCHKLIKEGAKLIENIDDILNECPALHAFTSAFTQHLTAQAIEKMHETTPDSSGSIKIPNTISPQSSPDFSHTTHESSGSIKNPNAPETIAEHLLPHIGDHPTHPDQLAATLDMDAGDIYAALIELEYQGKIAATAGGRYQKI